MALEGIYLDVDISKAQGTITALKMFHTEKEFKQIIYAAFKRTGEQTRTAVKRIVPKSYNVSQSTVYKHIGPAKTSFGGGGIGVSCSIPIDGKRLSIGGGFSARGGAPGWSTKAGKRYKITAKILKQQSSILPKEMKNQGGFPPFINTTAPKLNGVAFTRTGGKTADGKDAIAKVVGISIPQMPMNRSQDDVQENIANILLKRLEHEHSWRIKKCQR